MVWVVGVEVEFDEFVSSVWVVVGYVAGADVAGGADWVSLDDCSSECLVAFAVVSALGCCASGLIGLGPVHGASAALATGVDGWAALDAAHSHR